MTGGGPTAATAAGRRADGNPDAGGAPDEASAASPYKGKTGWTRVRNAFFYSLDGFAAALRNEDAFRQEVLLALVLVPVALLSPAIAAGKAIMVASVLLVLVVELLNSGIEAVTDRVSLEDHVLAKQAKDLGSAAVFLSLVMVPVVWLIVLLA
jgi:diacylglycerol kinase (ATP)